MSGSLQFIKEVTQSSSVTTFTVTDCFNDKYDVYQILISKADSNSDNLFLKLNFLDTSDTVITDSTYDTAGLRMQSNATTTEERHVNSSGFQKLAQFDATDSDSAGIKIMVFNPFDSSSFTFITSQTSSDVTGINITTKYIGVLKNTETVTGLRLGFTDSSGNLSSNGINDCIVNVYGVK